MVGRSLYKLLSPLFLKPSDGRRSEDVWVSVARVMFALKCLRDDRGELPRSLDGLVPGYLEEVPLDPATGRAIGYSPEKRILFVPGLKNFTIDL